MIDLLSRPFPYPRRRAWIAVVAVATAAASCSTSGSEPASIEPTLTVEEVAPTPVPSPTPLPTPTPVPPPTLTATPVGLGGLQELRSTGAIESGTVSVTVDGVVRAIDTPESDVVATIWVPAGDHEVCVERTLTGSAPVRWEVDAGTTQAVPAGPTAICGQVTGTLDVAPRLFPDHRVVAHYGSGITASLGVLGEGSPEAALGRLVDAAAQYEGFDERPVVPAFEFIVTVALGSPGDDGLYSKVWAPEVTYDYLDLVRSVGGVMFIDFQPGRAPFIDQVRHYEELLREPDVHLALDPEWSMGPEQVPGRVFGHTDPEAVEEVLDWVDALVQRHGLPQKTVILHQFQSDMIRRRDEIQPRPGVAIMYHIDGQGPVAAKYGTYDALSVEPPFFNGFKLFFDEDSRLMTPQEVMAIEPRPDYVSYQ